MPPISLGLSIFILVISFINYVSLLETILDDDDLDCQQRDGIALYATEKNSQNDSKVSWLYENYTNHSEAQRKKHYNEQHTTPTTASIFFNYGRLEAEKSRRQDMLKPVSVYQRFEPPKVATNSWDAPFKDWISNQSDFPPKTSPNGLTYRTS